MARAFLQPSGDDRKESTLRLQGDYAADIRMFDRIETEALRMAARGAADRMEAKGMAFQERVYQGFCAIAAEDPNRVKLIDATASIEDVFAQTVEQVCAYGLHISQDAVAAALAQEAE